MKKTVIWLDNYLEEFFMVISLILMNLPDTSLSGVDF